MESNTLADLFCKFSNVVNILPYYGYSNESLMVMLLLCQKSNSLVTDTPNVIQNCIKKEMNAMIDLDDITSSKDLKPAILCSVCYKASFKAKSVQGQKFLLKVINKIPFFCYESLYLGCITCDEELESSNNTIDALIDHKIIPELIEVSHNINLAVEKSYKEMILDSHKRIRYLKTIRLNEEKSPALVCDLVSAITGTISELNDFPQECCNIKPPLLHLTEGCGAYKTASLSNVSGTALSRAIQTVSIMIRNDKLCTIGMEYVKTILSVLPNVSLLKILCDNGAAEYRLLNILQHIHQCKIKNIEYRDFLGAIFIECSNACYSFSNDQSKIYKTSQLSIGLKNTAFSISGDDIHFRNVCAFKSKGIESLYLYDSDKGSNDSIDDEEIFIILPLKCVYQIKITDRLLISENLEAFNVPADVTLRENFCPKSVLETINQLGSQELRILKDTFPSYFTIPRLKSLLSVASTKNLVYFEANIDIDNSTEDDYVSIRSYLDDCESLESIQLQAYLILDQERVVSIIKSLGPKVSWILLSDRHQPSPEVVSLSSSPEFNIQFE